MKILSFVFLAALALGTSACGSATDPGAGLRVQATSDKSYYVTGDTAHIDLKNLSSAQLAFPGFCEVQVQENRGGEWVTISGVPGCPLSIEYLGAFGHLMFDWPVPTGLQGQYRLLVPSPTRMNGPAESPLKVEFSVNATPL